MTSLSQQETQEIITPFAFSVSKTLIGTPLATPFKRGVAMLFDMILVAFSSTLASNHPFALIGICFFILLKSLIQHNDAHSKLQKILKLMGIIFIALALVQISQSTFEWLKTSEKSAKAVAAQTQYGIQVSNPVKPVIIGDYFKLVIQLQTKNKGNDDCNPDEISCYGELNKQLISDLSTREITPHQIIEILVDMKNKALITPGQKDGLLLTLEKDTGVNFNQLHLTQNHKPTRSAIEWSKGVLSDLGLGFGWATIYFTLFLYWWNGQTPGKRLFKLRVVKLDGTPLGLWNSFERYGGYCAGLATGLLGFIQVYWDANRMAIQDKISETVVIDLSKEKREVPIANIQD